MNTKNTLLINILVSGVLAISLMGKASAFNPNFQGRPTGHMGGPPTSIGMGSPMPMGGPMADQIKLIKSLNLSLEQKGRLWTILDEFRPKVMTQVKSLHKTRQQVQTMMFSEMDQNSINNLADAQGRTISNLIKLRGQISFQIRSMLTSGQKDQLASLIMKAPRHIR